MEGTNVEEGRKILKEPGLNFTIGNDMKDGAEKIVKLARLSASIGGVR
jgi:succinyl-CoA synthetase beta subunit